MTGVTRRFHALAVFTTESRPCDDSVCGAAEVALFGVEVLPHRVEVVVDSVRELVEQFDVGGDQGLSRLEWVGDHRQEERNVLACRLPAAVLGSVAAAALTASAPASVGIRTSAFG